MIVVINGREGPIQYVQLTTYKRREGAWNPEPSITGALQLTNDTDRSRQSVNCGKNPYKTEIHQIHEKNKHLRFEFQGESWYKVTNNSLAQPSLISAKEKPKNKGLSEIWKEQKSGSWIWIENSSSGSHALTGLNYTFKPSGEYKKFLWRLQGCSQTYFPGSTELKWANQKAIVNIQENKIKKITKGKWVDTNEFCNYARKRNVSENEFKNLKLFCAIKKN